MINFLWYVGASLAFGIITTATLAAKLTVRDRLFKKHGTARAKFLRGK